MWGDRTSEASRVLKGFISIFSHGREIKEESTHPSDQVEVTVQIEAGFTISVER